MPMRIAYLEDGGIIATGDGVVTGGKINRVNDIIYESPEKMRKNTLIPMCPSIVREEIGRNGMF